MEVSVLGVRAGDMVFVRVNQVLVRLWACCHRKSDRTSVGRPAMGTVFRGVLMRSSSATGSV